MADDRRLIEDYLPIQAISAEASREKSVRKGHISTLHLWWARRPLVACRAAIYSALVPAERFRPSTGPEEKRTSLARANAAKFVERLCKYPGDTRTIHDAERQILDAHADRLTQENGKPVTVEDIVEGRARRPKVLDMFAGGGAIPLEALRLGCEAYALDLNPVAYIIELCTLIYPQTYGRPDPSARGMAGTKNGKGETTWGGLAEEIRYWGEWILEKVRAEIGDLYPLLPDPEFKMRKSKAQETIWKTTKGEAPHGYLVAVAYLWTRTVRCKNPSCGATVPLVRQTWLCKKKNRFVALKLIAPRGKTQVRFEVVEAASERGLGFDPSAFSKGGNATCPFCGTVADIDHVKVEGCAKRMGQQMMAVVCTRPERQGKIYLSADDYQKFVPDDDAIRKRLNTLCQRTGLTIPSEPVPSLDAFTCKTHLYGLKNWGDLFSARQTLCLVTFVVEVRKAEEEMRRRGYDTDRARALGTYLAILMDRQADYNSSGCIWESGGEFIKSTFSRQALPMVWDYSELAPFGDASGSPKGALDWIVAVAEAQAGTGNPAIVSRGSATVLPWADASFDAIITDPPYYDNVSYANLSDFFYVWLRRTVGDLYPEHFASELTPKKSEAIAEASRYGGKKEKARQAYEQMMARSFAQANRVLKPGGQMVVVYAHKTTLGWSTLVDALRQAGFTVTEAWPLETERPGRTLAIESAALASSIFLVARKRQETTTGEYEETVLPELREIVRERVDTLWKMGISGADLVIAAVGAGLRAYTRFAEVQYANGDPVLAEKFLAEVEGLTLETLLEKIFGLAGSGVGAIDGPSRFYVLWRYAYPAPEMDAGEAIVFTYGQQVELDGSRGLSTGSRALLEKKKGKYKLKDFTERGKNEKLGVADDDGGSPPLIDSLHRVLWLLEHQPRKLSDYLEEANPDRERMRLIAQVLAGTALEGSTGNGGGLPVHTTQAEHSALNKLVGNWRSLMEQGRPTRDQQQLTIKM